MFRFTIDVRADHEDELVYAECRELKGCHTFGETEKEALDRVVDVMMDHLGARLRNQVNHRVRPTPSHRGDGHSHVVEIEA